MLNLTSKFTGKIICFIPPITIKFHRYKGSINTGLCKCRYRIRCDKEAKRNKQKVFDLWLACETQEAIAEAVGIAQKTVDNWIEDFSKSLGSKELLKFHFQDDFTPPIYNVWRLQRS